MRVSLLDGNSTLPRRDSAAQSHVNHQRREADEQRDGDDRRCERSTGMTGARRAWTASMISALSMCLEGRST